MQKPPSSKMRLAIAFGATMGVGHALMRALTANLGPVLGMVAGLVAIAALTTGIFLLLERSAKHVSQLEKH